MEWVQAWVGMGCNLDAFLWLRCLGAYYEDRHEAWRLMAFNNDGMRLGSKWECRECIYELCLNMKYIYLGSGSGGYLHTYL